MIAISQDPLAKSAIRIKRDVNVKKDEYGVGEAQIWSGKLLGGDQVVIFLNAADEDLDMKASLEEIFIRETGRAPQAQENWDVYDLWANRMSDSVAQKIIDHPEKSASILSEIDWYNSTALPYKEGIAKGDKRLLGKKTEVLKARTIFSKKVKRHSAQMYRLRSPDREAKKENLPSDDNHNEL